MAVDVSSILIVLLAGIISDLATGLGVLPFYWTEDISDRMLTVLWGTASGIMVTVSVLELIPEALSTAQASEFFRPVLTLVGGGLLLGMVFVWVSSRLVDEVELSPDKFSETDFKSMILVLGVLTAHSLPEGLAIGVAFAELGLSGVIPPIAIFITLAISLQNIPEGLAIAIPFKAAGASNRKAVGAAIFSSIPQPIGAVAAFLFVAVAEQLLPLGYSLAAGAMVFLVLTEFVDEVRELTEENQEVGWKHYLIGVGGGTLMMVLLTVLLG